MSNASKGATALAGAVAAFVAFAPSSTQVDPSTDQDASSGAISSAATKAIQKKWKTRRCGWPNQSFCGCGRRGRLLSSGRAKRRLNLNSRLNLNRVGPSGPRMIQGQGWLNAALRDEQRRSIRRQDHKYCNLRCAYCYEYPHLGDKARMSLETLGRIFENIRAPMRRIDMTASISCGTEANRSWSRSMKPSVYCSSSCSLPGLPSPTWSRRT